VKPGCQLVDRAEQHRRSASDAPHQRVQLSFNLKKTQMWCELYVMKDLQNIKTGRTEVGSTLVSNIFWGKNNTQGGGGASDAPHQRIELSFNLKKGRKERGWVHPSTRTKK